MVPIHLRSAWLLSLAILYGTGECSVITVYTNNSYCSDADCLPLRIIKIEYLINATTLYPLCGTANVTAEMVKNQIEQFFNQKCPAATVGPDYNKTKIESACRNSGRISTVRLTNNCSSATTYTQPGYKATTYTQTGYTATTYTQSEYKATTSSLKEGQDFALNIMANGSRGSNSTTSGGTLINIGDTAAAVVCTSVGALFIAFLSVYLWRRKMGKECLHHRTTQAKKALSLQLAASDTAGKEFGECGYENYYTRQIKLSENGMNVTKALEDGQSNEFGDQSTELHFMDTPCYLEIMPSNSKDDSVSTESRGEHFVFSNVQHDNDKEQHDDHYYSFSRDATYFALEQFEPLNTDRNKVTPANEGVVAASADRQCTAEPQTFNLTHSNYQVAS